jgi:AcrR family transcriptional regulator
MDVALSRDHWVQAALEALAEEGLAGVAVEPLARRLGATKGSFYWHFADRDGLIAATVERWEQADTTELITALGDILEPRERLVALARYAYGEAARGTDPQAGILAAAADPRVAPTLARVTRARLDFLAELYRELGLPPARARERARVAYALYLGLGALRRAAPEPGTTAPGLGAELEVVIDALLPAG